MLRPVEGPVHFIGVGGAGMSPLAEVLLARHFRVSGSDIRRSALTDRLIAHGAQIRIGHEAAALNGANIVVYSTAIRPDNPELVAAQERGLRIMHRSELLAELLADQNAIAVAGSHGKSTTSGMLATILVETGLDPTAIIGGEVRNLGAHHRVGEGPYFVFEACESDGSFLRYHDCNQIITNLEPDHLDQHHTFENLVTAFRKFVALSREDGFVVYNADSAPLRDIVSQASGRPVSYGLAETADYRVLEVTTDVHCCSLELRSPDGKSHRVHLAVPGEHNALNAAAAIAAAVELGVDIESVTAALPAFTGIGRRFEVLYEEAGMLVVDDYAHHPTEIKATLATARRIWKGPIIAVFQPHLFSRTQRLMDEFACAFRDADEVFITEIYAAREDPIPGVSGARLAEAVRAQDPTKPIHSYATNAEVLPKLLSRLKPGVMVLVLGAGDVGELATSLAKTLRQSSDTNQDDSKCSPSR
ncbi:MAG: UDP-N-acetylmuramate--L-alanine ligase [Candidatus Zipacnadales bacterium]